MLKTIKNAEIDIQKLSLIIKRNNINCDIERRCRKTQLKDNLYICLTCGSIFSHFDNSSPLIDHYINNSHTLVMSLTDYNFYLIPNFELVKDEGKFDDVRFSFSLVYNDTVLKKLSDARRDGIEIPNEGTYYPGTFCMDGPPMSHGHMAAIRFLSSIDVLRDEMLSTSYGQFSSNISLFFRKLFNPYAFRKSISLLPLLKSIEIISEKEFSSEGLVTPEDLILWLISSLKNEGVKSLKNVFNGKLYVKSKSEKTGDVTDRKSNFIYLPLNIEDSPLYLSSLQKEQVIPKTPLKEFLKKYDGKTVNYKNDEGAESIERTMKIEKEPNYLWINCNRIRKTRFDPEKLNIHIILPHDDVLVEEIKDEKIKVFQKLDEIHGTKKKDKVNHDTSILDLAIYDCKARYELICTISHEGLIQNGVYVTYLYIKESNKWVKCESSNTRLSLIQEVENSHTCHLLYKRI